MTSLQEALQKAIKDWTEPEDQQQEKHMTKSERIFNYIRDYEGCTPKDVIDALFKQGIKISTTETMIGKFIKVGMVTRDEVCNELFVKTPNYTPLLTFAKEHGTLKKKKVSITKRKKESKPISLSPLPEIFKAPKKEWHTDDVLNELSVIQARKLYDALLIIFTGRQV
jgi:hypothetical protein